MMTSPILGGCDGAVASDAETLPGTPPISGEQMHADETPVVTTGYDAPGKMVCHQASSEFALKENLNQNGILAAHTVTNCPHSQMPSQSDYNSDAHHVPSSSCSAVMASSTLPNDSCLHQTMGSQTLHEVDASNHAPVARFPWAASASPPQQMWQQGSISLASGHFGEDAGQQLSASQWPQGCMHIETSAPYPQSSPQSRCSPRVATMWSGGHRINSQIAIEPPPPTMQSQISQGNVCSVVTSQQAFSDLTHHTSMPSDAQPSLEQTQHFRTKPKVTRRLKSHMLVQGQRSIAIPCSYLLRDEGEPPQIAYLPVEDPITGSSYMLCNFCKSDKMFTDVAGLVRHLEGGECPHGYAELCRVRADTQAADQSLGAVSERATAALEPLANKHGDGSKITPSWPSNASSKFTNRSIPSGKIRPYRPVQRRLGKATTKLKHLRELQRISPRLFAELGCSIRGLLNCTSSELARILAEARQKPEDDAPLGNEEALTLVSSSDFGKVQKAFGERFASSVKALSSDAPREDDHLVAQTLTCRSILSEVEKVAPFTLVACRSKFLEQDMQLEGL